MSQRDHNTLLCALHLGWGCLNLLALSAARGMFAGNAGEVGWQLYSLVLGVFGQRASDWGSVVFFLVFFMLLSLPSLVAGYGMLKRRRWARGAGVVAAVMASLSPPLGTALCVYTLWFVFGEGRDFYERESVGE